APVVSNCPADFTIYTGEGRTTCNGAATWVAPTAIDNCGAVSVTGNHNPGETFPVGITNVTYTFTDTHGNSSVCSFNVTVIDNTPPVITCPANTTVNCQDNNSSSATGTPTATDNCSPVTITQTQTSTQSSNPASAGYYNYVISRTWRATDQAGNYIECTQLITVHDVTAPTAICKTVTVTLVNGSAVIIPASVNNESYDNCGPVSLAVSKSTFNCSDIGANNVSLTVTDVSGNTKTCSTTVTVVGEIPSCSITAVPVSNVYTGGVPTNLYIGYGPQSVTLQVSAPASGAPYSYAWSGGTLSNYNTANPVFTATTPGTFTFLLTTTNKYGCTTSCSISICVSDPRTAGTSGNNQKINICHNGHSISVSINAVATHINGHPGDRLGNCNEMPCTAPGIARGTNVKQTPKAETPATVGQLEVTAGPNPSNSFFLISVKSNSIVPVTLRIMNSVGQFIDADRSVTPGSVVRIGDAYDQGTYYLQATQGKTKKMVTLIKLK
ncbi:MAG: HYR domain-containing protein, partial [Ferruginibacter sp.]